MYQYHRSLYYVVNNVTNVASTMTMIGMYSGQSLVLSMLAQIYEAQNSPRNIYKQIE